MFNRHFANKAQFSFHSLTERRQVLIEWTLFFCQTLPFFVFHSYFYIFFHIVSIALIVQSNKILWDTICAFYRGHWRIWTRMGPNWGFASPAFLCTLLWFWLSTRYTMLSHLRPEIPFGRELSPKSKGSSEGRSRAGSCSTSTSTPDSSTKMSRTS